MELRDRGNRIANPDMYPETWIKLIERADIYTGKIARSIKSFFRRKINDIADYLVKEGFIRREYFERKLDRNEIVSYGVDSSRGRILRYMGYVLVPVSAAYVKVCLVRGDKNNVKIKVSRPHIIADIPNPPIDGVDPSVALILAELEMLEKELEILRKLKDVAEENSLVLIDGPIIDPPNVRRNEAIKYLERRRAAISSLLRRNINVIGFVKRIQGKSVIDYLKSQFKLNINDIPETLRNDWSFISIVLGNIAYRYNYTILKEKIEKENIVYVFYTYPLIEETDINYNNIFKKYGVHIYSTFILVLDKSRIRRNVARVDIAAEDTPDEKYVKKIVQNLALLYMAGLRYPLPIELAHNSCRIPKTSASYLLKEVMTRSVAKTVGEGITEIAPILDIVTSLM